MEDEPKELTVVAIEGDEEAPPAPGDDGRLDRLFNYTRFHIGIYLAIGGGIAALFGSSKSFTEVSKMIGSPSALLGGLLFMAIAGLAGGIVASTTTVHRSLDDMWEAETGPWDWPLFKARRWAAIEHTAFWL